jgi:hypothetical protein
MQDEESNGADKSRKEHEEYSEGGEPSVLLLHECGRVEDGGEVVPEAKHDAASHLDAQEAVRGEAERHFVIEINAINQM